MSDMKCPVCGGRLVYWGATGALLKCEQCKFGWGNEELWQELIRTRKALDVAVDALKEIKDGKTPVSLGIGMDINDALEQITALDKIKELDNE